jgi:uncharacterized protein (TIGR03118 family)
VRQTFLLAVLAACVMAGSAAADHGHHGRHNEPNRRGDEKNGYLVHNLVSDQSGVADHTDPNLVNAWGLTSLAASPWWIADNGTDKATVYDAAGNPFPTSGPIVVNVPSAPTGAAANPGSGFVVSNGSASGAATFLFSTEEGKILGWNRTVSATQAVVAVDDTTQHAVFKGLTLSPDGSLLYATDFHNGRVDVFDSGFHPVTTAGAFVDPRIPSGFAPFGIQAVNGQILVTYAKQDAQRHDDVAGQGNGFVDAFDTSGKLLARVGTHGQLNSPWGLALAPSTFGRFSGDLLVGNFGDGRINAFAMRSDGRFEPAGGLRMDSGHRIAIDGLWSLQFGHGAAVNGPTNTLFFTAGPGDEQHGLFGTIQAH